MRLALLVVYLFRPDRRRLFRIHLEHIRRNTRVPYRIFGAVGHLDDALAAEVAAEPDIKALKLPVGVLPGREEHADLLERLFHEALKGDYTHFVTMHLDSFPVAPDWSTAIAEQIANGAAFATIAPHGYSACLFWPRALHERHGVRLLVPEEDRASKAFGRFREAHPGYDHIETGLGLLWQAWRDGQSWHELRSTGQHVYGGRVFHLVAGTRYTSPDHTPIRFRRAVKASRPAIGIIKHLIPHPLRHRLRRAGYRLLADPYRRGRDGSAAEKRSQLDRLLTDPDGFLRECGVPPAG